MVCYSAHSLGGLSVADYIKYITPTFNLNWLFLQQLRSTSLSVFILTHPVNFPVGGNRSARRKPTTFGRVLTDSFRMSRVALGKFPLRIEPATSEVKGERTDHCATEAPLSFMVRNIVESPPSE